MSAWLRRIAEQSRGNHRCEAEAVVISTAGSHRILDVYIMTFLDYDMIFSQKQVYPHKKYRSIWGGLVVFAVILRVKDVD